MLLVKPHTAPPACGSGTVKPTNIHYINSNKDKGNAKWNC
uniref:Uncharacterized protein n=1 Tax=Rhizophora mucronata TaxID=61149 RepID=A0A2P2NYF2_RHIMU